MNKEEIIKYCLTLPNTFADCPFPGDMESTTIKHADNKKWFFAVHILKRFKKSEEGRI